MWQLVKHYQKSPEEKLEYFNYDFIIYLIMQILVCILVVSLIKALFVKYDMGSLLFPSH